MSRKNVKLPEGDVWDRLNDEKQESETWEAFLERLLDGYHSDSGSSEAVRIDDDQLRGLVNDITNSVEREVDDLKRGMY